MNSLEIQYFLTIVKYGSFTEAAQALSVSQPAISKQIRQLEAELGCSLFTRSGRTLSLTEAGQEILPLQEAASQNSHRWPESPHPPTFSSAAFS